MHAAIKNNHLGHMVKYQTVYYNASVECQVFWEWMEEPAWRQWRTSTVVCWCAITLSNLYQIYEMSAYMYEVSRWHGVSERHLLFLDPGPPKPSGCLHLGHSLWNSLLITFISLLGGGGITVFSKPVHSNISTYRGTYNAFWHVIEITSTYLTILIAQSKTNGERSTPCSGSSVK